MTPWFRGHKLGQNRKVTVTHKVGHGERPRDLLNKLGQTDHKGHRAFGSKSRSRRNDPVTFWGHKLGQIKG